MTSTDPTDPPTFEEGRRKLEENASEGRWRLVDTEGNPVTSTTMGQLFIEYWTESTAWQRYSEAVSASNATDLWVLLGRIFGLQVG